MTVWALRTDDKTLLSEARTSLVVPLPLLAGLANAHSEGAVKQVLRAERIDATPEALSQEAAALWHVLGSLAVEDVIVILHEKRVRAAEITAPMRYTGHAWEVPVRVFPPRSLEALGRARAALRDARPFFEIIDPDLRTRARAMARRRQRFAGWKWLVTAFLLMQLVVLLLRTFGKL